MLTVPAATARISRQVLSSEAILAEALVEVTSLAHSLSLAAQAHPDVAPVQSQAALLRITKTTNALLEARADLTRLHGQLRDISSILAPEEPTCPKAIDNNEGGIVAEALRIA